MKKIIIAALTVLFTINSYAQDVLIFSAKNNNGTITPKTIEEAFVKHGFEISENRDMNLPFTKQFGKTVFDVYNLFTPYHMDVVKELIKDYPNIGLFSPMSLSIWTKKGENEIHVSVLSADTIAKITGIPADNPHLHKLEKIVRETIKDALPDAKETKASYNVRAADKALVTSYTYEMDAEDYEDEKEEFMMMFESELNVHGFVLAGFNDIQYILDERKIDAGYDFYDVESICKLPVIYTVSQSRPEAGAFAPCSIYFYKKTGEGMMHIAFPNVYNWLSSLNIDDKESIDQLEDAQERIVTILDTVTE